MASFTSFLNLLKKNPATDGKDTFNIETMLNENWDKIDLKVEENSSAIGQKQDKLTTPTQTVITSGFSAGYSGKMVFSKNQEGLVTIEFDITKDSDFTLASVLVYTIPAGFRHKNNIPIVDINKVGLTSAGSYVTTSTIDIIIWSTGTIYISGRGTLTNARRVMGVLHYYGA